MKNNKSGGMPTWLSLLLLCTYLASKVTAFPTRYPGRTPACLEEESSCDVPSSTVYTTIIPATASPTQIIVTTSSDLSATFSTKPSPSSTQASSSTSAATPVIGKAAEATRIRSGNRLPRTYADFQPQRDEIDHQHREGSNKNPPADAFAGLDDNDNVNFSGQNETESRFVRGDSFIGSFEEQTFLTRGGPRGRRGQYRASLVTSPKVRRIKEYVFRPHNRYAVDFGLSEIPVGWTPFNDVVEADRRAEREAEKLAALSAAEADFKSKAAMSKASSEAKDAETLLMNQQRIKNEENERKRQADYAVLTGHLQQVHYANENRREEEHQVALAMAADSRTKSDLAKNAADDEREKYEHLVFLQQSLLEQGRREDRRAAMMVPLAYSSLVVLGMLALAVLLYGRWKQVKHQSRPDKKPFKGSAPPPDDPPPPSERPSPPQQSQPPAADDVKPPSDDEKPLDNEHTPESGGAPETVVTVRTVRHDVVRYTSEVTTITNNVIFDWSAVAHTFSRSPPQAPPRAAVEEPESVLMNVELISATPIVDDEQSEQPAPSLDLSAILSTAAEPEATTSGGVGAKKADVNMLDILELVKKRRQAESSERAIALADVKPTSPVTIADSVSSTGNCVDVSSPVEHDETAQTPLECEVEPCDTVMKESTGTDDPTAPSPGLPAPMVTAEVPLETDDANKTDKMMADIDETKNQQSGFAEAVTWPATLALNVSAVPADVQPSWIDLSEFRDTLRGVRRLDACSNQEDVGQTDSVSDSLTKTSDGDSLPDTSEGAVEPVSSAYVSGSIEVQADADVAAESLIAETPLIPDALAPQASVELAVNLVSMCPVHVHTEDIPSMASITVQTEEAPSLCSDAVETDEAPSTSTIAVQTEEAPPMCSVTVQPDDMKADVSRNEGSMLNDEKATFVDIAPAPQSSVASVSVSESSACSLDVQSDGKDAAVANSNEQPCTIEEEMTMTEVPAHESAIQSVSTSSTATCSVAVQEDNVEVPESPKKEQTSKFDILVYDSTSTDDFQPANTQIEDRKDETTPKTNSHFDQHGNPQSTVDDINVIASTTGVRDCDGSTALPEAHPVTLEIEITPKIQTSFISAKNLSTSRAKASSPPVSAVTAEQSLVGAFEKIALDSTSETRPPSPSIAKTPASKGGKAFKALAWYPPSASPGSRGTASTAVPFSATAFGRIAFGYTAYAESGRLFPNDFAYSASSFGLPPRPSKTTGFAFDSNSKFSSSSRPPVSQSSSQPPVAKGSSQTPSSKSDSQPPLSTAILDRVTPTPSGSATLPRIASSPTALHPSVAEPLQSLDSSKASLNTKAKKSADTARPDTTIAQEKKGPVTSAVVQVDATRVQLPSTLVVTQIAATPAELPSTLTVPSTSALELAMTPVKITGSTIGSNAVSKRRTQPRLRTTVSDRATSSDSATLSGVASNPTALLPADAEPSRSTDSSRWSNAGLDTNAKESTDSARPMARMVQEKKELVATVVVQIDTTPAQMPCGLNTKQVAATPAPLPSTLVLTQSAQLPASLVAPCSTPVADVVEHSRSLGSSRWSNPAPKTRSEKSAENTECAPLARQERTVNEPASIIQTSLPSVPSTSSPVVPSSPPALVVADPQRGLASSRWSDPVPKAKNKNDRNNAPRAARVSQERRVNVPTLLTRTLQSSAHSSSTSAVSPGPSAAINADVTRSLDNSRWATPQSNARRGADSARSALVPQERRANFPIASSRTTWTPPRSSETRRGGRGQG